MIEKKYILLTIDVEDWFQVENFKPWIPFETWDQRELRVERNVHRLLDLFDEIEVRDQKTEDRRQKRKEQKKYPQNPVNPVRKNKTRIKATFFILGWIAERLPHLIREIQDRGHEVASHGCNHQLSNQLSHEALKTELDDSRKILEDIIGGPVKGFRAPSFATSNYAMIQIAESGYLYDSSYNSFSLHGRYGQISLNGTGKKGIAYKISDNFYELPISNLMISRRVLPWGGGAYFRLIPYGLFRRGVLSILKKDRAYVFYMHPWEVDSEQPKVNQASFSFKFRHYKNLNKSTTRLKHLIENFGQCRFVTCNEYLNWIRGFGLQD